MTRLLSNRRADCGFSGAGDPHTRHHDPDTARHSAPRAGRGERRGGTRALLPPDPARHERLQEQKQ